MFIVLDAFQVVGVEGCDSFTMRNRANLRVVLSNLLPYPYPGESNLVHLLEIRVIVVEKAPKLEVDECCLFEALEDLLLLLLCVHFAD